MKKEVVLALLRLSLGFIFLWAFFDKLFGLGFNTTSDKSWLMGVSPTFGFLKFGATGFLGSYFQNLAGIGIIDWLFMIGLLFIGIGLIFGIATRLACYAGSVLFFLMWLALVPGEHNPIVDDHLIYLFVLLGLTKIDSTKYLSITKAWKNTDLVKKYKFLE